MTYGFVMSTSPQEPQKTFLSPFVPLQCSQMIFPMASCPSFACSLPVGAQKRSQTKPNTAFLLGKEVMERLSMDLSPFCLQAPPQGKAWIIKYSFLDQNAKLICSATLSMQVCSSGLQVTLTLFWQGRSNYRPDGPIKGQERTPLWAISEMGLGPSNVPMNLLSKISAGVIPYMNFFMSLMRPQGLELSRESASRMIIWLSSLARVISSEAWETVKNRSRPSSSFSFSVPMLSVQALNQPITSLKSSSEQKRIFWKPQELGCSESLIQLRQYLTTMPNEPAFPPNTPRQIQKFSLSSLLASLGFLICFNSPSLSTMSKPSQQSANIPKERRRCPQPPVWQCPPTFTRGHSP